MTDDRNYLKALDEVRAQRDAALARAEAAEKERDDCLAAEARCATLEAALQLIAGDKMYGYAHVAARALAASQLAEKEWS